MQPQTKKYLTPEEYLAIERAAEYKSEYFGGEMFALAGAGEWHNLSGGHSLIALNIAGELRARLKKTPCRSYIRDMRVALASDYYTYPDVVVCDHPVFQDSTHDTLLNPTIVVEVLSESTEAYDRGGKFEHYPRVESLREYVLVRQDRPFIEHYQRHNDGRWLLADIQRLDASLVLTSIGCEIPLAEIYDKVDLSGAMPQEGTPAS